MSDTLQSTPDTRPLHSVLAEARDLIRQLEGSTVQRLVMTAGDCSIEIERAPSPAADGSAARRVLRRPRRGGGPGAGRGA